MPTEAALAHLTRAPRAQRSLSFAGWPLLAAGVAVPVGLLAGVNPALALVAVVGLVVGALILVDVTVGLCVFVLIAYIEALPRVGGEVSTAKFAGLLLVGSWIATIAVRRRGRAGLLSEHAGFTALLAVFIAWILVTLSWADDGAGGREALQRFALNVALFPIVFTAVRRRSHVLAVVVVMIFGAVLAAASGIADPSAVRAGERLSGAGFNPNQLGALLLIGAALAAGLAAGRSHLAATRVAAASAAAFCTFGVLLTVSRGAVVGLVVAIVAAVAFAGRGRRLRVAPLAVLALAVGGFYFAALAGPSARDRVLRAGDGSARIDLWQVGWRMVDDRPFTGVGAGNFKSSLDDYIVAPGLLRRSDRVLDRPTVAHNVYLQVWAELGLVGFTLFVCVLGFALRSALQAARLFERRRDHAMALIALGTFAALAGTLAAAFFGSWLFSKVLWLLLAFAVALAGVARSGDHVGQSAYGT